MVTPRRGTSRSVVADPAAALGLRGAESPAQRAKPKKALPLKGKPKASSRGLIERRSEEFLIDGAGHVGQP